MKTSQLAIQQEEEKTAGNTHSHGFNLRKRPTKQREQISLAQAETTTGVAQQNNPPKTTRLCMLTQMNVREGLEAFRKKEMKQKFKSMNNYNVRRHKYPLITMMNVKKHYDI